MTSILIIDDEPDIREVIRFALEGTGFRIHEAGHTEEARKLLGSEDLDLTLLDWMLPEGVPGWSWHSSSNRMSQPAPSPSSW